ncbi:MAG: SPASM domain-containing protein, partial [Desulfobulbaceae bacterium]|nr:SPASM domain-containing protein [Desulfobulbaceae bacterium]
LCHGAGMPVAFNICLQRDDFFNGVFEEVMNKARTFGGCLVQLIHPKRAGIWLENGPGPFSTEDIEQVKKLVTLYNLDPNYADYPSISAQIVEEAPEMFGCTAGATDRFYINAQGEVQPCEFLNISFGNIAEEDFSHIYRRMRDVFKHPGTNWLCEKYSPEIAKIYHENNLKTMPLSGELSARIYNELEQGASTELYSKIRNIGGEGR